ncbi:unnamed protein product [Spirodela intermedia]|uniref:Uncharacterized protein n=1 Tax=Spirodela intermedia TaxID=51605 RepID=A0A7I8JM11_SPIIN|nr:unnamed protein product [Spirodela intermedia]CAA6671198.1 unnamed protein product [Spirodela intermedia]
MNGFAGRGSPERRAPQACGTRCCTGGSKNRRDSLSVLREDLPLKEGDVRAPEIPSGQETQSAALPGGPQAAPAGDPAAENGGTSGDTRGMEVSKENGMVSAGEAAAILRSDITAPGGQSSVAARPCRKKRRMPKTGRPELNRDDGGEEGNYCQQGVTSEIEASCCRGKRRKAGGSGTGSNDEETSEGRCVHKCTICGTMDTDLNRPPPRGRAMDIDLNRLPPSEDDSGNVPGTIHETTL